MKNIQIDDDVHKALSIYKADKCTASLSEAIRALLINADYMRTAGTNPLPRILHASLIFAWIHALPSGLFPNFYCFLSDTEGRGVIPAELK